MAKISIDPILRDWIEDNELEDENISLTQLRRWAIDIVKDFTTVDMYVDRIAHRNIYNTKADLPEDFKMLISIAYRINESKKDCITVEEIVEFTQKCDDGCDYVVNVKCSKCKKDKCSCNNPVVEIDIDRMQMMHNPWYYDASRFAKPGNTSELYSDGRKDTRGRFKRMANATDPFFNADTHIPECVNLRCTDCDKRYVIHTDTNVVETNITEPNAELLIAYKAMQSDSEGNPLIPDNTNAIEAIEYQLSYKYYRKKFKSSGSNVFRALYKEAQAERDIAVGRLKSELGIPDPNNLRAGLSQIMHRPRNQAPTRTYSDNTNQFTKY